MQVNCLKNTSMQKFIYQATVNNNNLMTTELWLNFPWTYMTFRKNGDFRRHVQTPFFWFLLYILFIFCTFSSFLISDGKRHLNIEKDDFDQQTECKALVYWLKYTNN